MKIFQSMKTYQFLIAIIICSVPAVFPLLSEGFIKTDDGDWMIIRFSAFYQALIDGQFPVRWLPRLNNSYGYPVANFLYPGFMYLAVPIKALGFSYIDSIKIILVTSMITSAAFCYLWLKNHFSHIAAFIGAIVYLYLPYHIYDLYVRGSVGELLALSCVPFILWQIDRRSIFFTSLGVGMLILSHNTLAFLSFPIIIVYLFILSKERKEALMRILSVIFGVLLAGFFWIPSLYDLQFTVFLQTVVSNYAEYFSDISLVGLIVPVIFMVSLGILYKDQIKPQRLYVFFFIVGLLTLFFASNASVLFWEILPIAIIQFPFRVLSLLLLSTAFISAWVFHATKNRVMQIILGVCLLLLLFPSFLLISNAEKTDTPDSVYGTNEDTTTVQKEYMPKWVNEIPQTRPNAVLLVGESAITDVMRAQSNLHTTVEVSEPTIVTYNQFFFPGWIAKVDGTEKTIEYEDNNGLIVFPLEAGRHTIELSFNETPVRLIANTVSFLCFLIVLISSLYFKLRYVKKSKT